MANLGSGSTYSPDFGGDSVKQQALGYASGPQFGDNPAGMSNNDWRGGYMAWQNANGPQYNPGNPYGNTNLNLGVDDQAYNNFLSQSSKASGQLGLSNPNGAPVSNMSQLQRTNNFGGSNFTGWADTNLYQGGGQYTTPGQTYHPLAGDTFGMVNSLQSGGDSSIGQSPYSNYSKRLVSFEDMRNNYQNQIFRNREQASEPVYAGWAQIGLNRSNDSLSQAYNALVGKMKESGSFGMQGRFNQASGYTQGGT